jgi:hypothetical protein
VAVAGAVAWAAAAAAGGAAPPSSPASTAHDGTAALAQLLADRGHPVVLRRAQVSAAPDLGVGTLLVADPVGLSASEISAVTSWVEHGGRLVAAGSGLHVLLVRLLGSGGAPRWSPDGLVSARPLVASPTVAGVATVAAHGTGAWATSGRTRAVLGLPGRALAVEAPIGAGELVALADASPLHNDLLGSADNALFALELAGPGPVVFDEADQAYGADPWSALPERWRVALLIASLAALCWVWSAGRRLGPPEEADTEPVPARRRHVDALAAAIARSAAPADAAAPVQEEGRRLLIARAGTSGPSAAAGDPSASAEAARLVGMPDDLARALLHPAQSDQDVVAVGRALAWLVGSRDAQDGAMPSHRRQATGVR